jgi:hypothetical protein
MTIPSIGEGEEVELGFQVESLSLLPGLYQLELHVKDMATQKIEMVPQYFPMEVVETPVYGGRKLDRWFGTIALKAKPIVNEGHSSVFVPGHNEQEGSIETGNLI